jgi:hypothetical protein
VTEIHELLQELADTPAPPSSFGAEQTFAAGRQRRRRRRTVLSVIAAAVAVALVGGGTAVATIGRGAEPQPAESATTRPDPRPGAASPGTIVQLIQAADAQHLYLAYMHCTGSACTKTLFDLVGSDDGGRSWSTRAEGLGAYSLQTAGAGQLVSVAGTKVLGSTDGGRTWAELTVDTGSAASLPEGGTLTCRATGGERPCQLSVVKLAERRVVPLAAQPPIATGPQAVQSFPGGRIWAYGNDPVTGSTAVASSVDGGQHWSAKAFDHASGLSTVDGRTVYVTTEDRVYRFDGGGWTVMDAADMPAGVAPRWSYVAADGSIIVCTTAARSDDTQYWKSDGKGPFSRVQPAGLPDRVREVRRTPGGWYYTSQVGTHEQHIFGSTDGLRWERIF